MTTRDELLKMAERLSKDYPENDSAYFYHATRDAASLLRRLAGEMEGAAAWRDIETAPRDGTYFLGLHQGSEVLVNWPTGNGLGEWNFHKGNWTGAAKYDVSKWRPLQKAAL